MFEEENFIQQNAVEPEAPPQPPQYNQVQAIEYIPFGFTPETYREKRDIRRRAVVIGIPCLCLSLISVVWSIVYLFFTTKFLRLDYNEAISLANNPAVQQILQVVLSTVMFLVPFPIVAKCAGYRIDSIISFAKPKKGTFLPFLFFGIGFCAFANIAMSYSSAFFDGFGIEYDVPYSENPSGVFGFLLTFIATAIVPALVEEFACRGIVLGLLKKYGEAFAIITSSIVFGVMHGNFDQMPFAVMVGLILGYIYVKTGSIWVSVAVHCANNAVSVIFTYLERIVTTNTQNLFYLFYLIFALLAAIYGVYLLSKKSHDIYTLKKADTASREKQKYTWVFTSWIIIVFIALNLLESLTYFIIN